MNFTVFRRVSEKIELTIELTINQLFPRKNRLKILGLYRSLSRLTKNPPIGAIRFGDLRRLTPIDRTFGMRRGTIIDRYYIEKFLLEHIYDIKGHVLEFGDDRYTQKFGGNRIVKSDVLDVVEGNPKSTIIADLTKADNVASNTFDCIICTQTIQMIYDLPAAIHNLHRILKPGGVLLVTSHGTSKICRREGIDAWGEYWRLTTQSARKLFQEAFPSQCTSVKAYGNVLSAVAFLHGIAQEELTSKELDFFDPDFEVLVGVRAIKPKDASTTMKNKN